MFALLCELKVKPGQGAGLEKVYSGPFSAAITAQEGFRNVFLLRSNDGGDYVLAIVFDTQALQQKWVASDLHQQVWGQMDSNLESFTVKTYTTV